MHNRVIVTAAAVAATIGVAACSSENVVSASVAAPPRAAASLIPIDVLGSNHVPPGQACKAAGYHEFDFWIGNWDVRGPAGGFSGTNVVKSRLDGCVVEENWTSAGVGFGRSLNFYDAAANTWSQMWVASSGCGNGVIIIEGTVENGVMTMRGRKEQPNGFLVGPPCAPPPTVNAFAMNNLIRWSQLPTGQVLQQFTSTLNNTPLPEPAPGSGLRYTRVASVTPLNPADPSFCPAFQETSQFDFMLGTWDIHEGNGNGAQATTTFTKGLHGCLVEEVVTGSGGYEGVSFNAFDSFTDKWSRTYIDTDGVRLLLYGTLENGAMVLTGKKQGADGSLVRVSWIPVATDRVVQRWEISRNDGTDWSNAKELVYTRQ
jgi:hypothetical protein